jgi:uncharacterized lipoprotein YehR (DUF1307 family)
MKIRTSGIAILAMTIIILSACKKDDKTTKNSFKYNNKETEIGTVYGGSLGESPTSGVYGTLIYFIEKTITLNSVAGAYDSLSGTGDILLLTFLSNSSGELPSGDYIFNVSEDPFVANSFGYKSGLLVNVNTAGNDIPASIALNGGKITVKKNTDDYEFTLNIINNVNSTITGYYKGKIIPANFLTEKKSQTKNPFSNHFLKY